MSLRIKVVVDKFVQELKEALDADIQDRIMKEREMQSYIEEREREVAEREAAWKAELSRREAEIARQEARLKIEKENLEKEKSVLMGTASNQDNQDGALEITVSGEKYRCLRIQLLDRKIYILSDNMRCLKATSPANSSSPALLAGLILVVCLRRKGEDEVSGKMQKGACRRRR
ncbi:hypothetical protein ACLB2K_016312 [Fragaria x ananassa]